MTPPIHVGLTQHPIKKGAGGTVSHIFTYYWIENTSVYSHLNFQETNKDYLYNQFVILLI